jgi:hypothetical protein
MSIGIDIFSRQLDFSPIEIARSIGTSGHAAAATDTPIVIDDDNAIRLGPGSSDRAAFHTNGISALLALDWEVKMPFIRYFLIVVVDVGVYEIYALLFFHFQDFNPEHLGISGLVVLLHTSVDTFAAADASRDI